MVLIHYTSLKEFVLKKLCIVCFNCLESIYLKSTKFSNQFRLIKTTVLTTAFYLGLTESIVFNSF